MNFNLEKYLHHVQCFDLTDAQRLELLYAVWAIVESAVDSSFAPQTALGREGEKPDTAISAAFRDAHNNKQQKAIPAPDDRKRASHARQP